MSKILSTGEIKKLYTFLLVIGFFLTGCTDEPAPAQTEEPGDAPHGLRLTEIHYHPLDDGGIDGDSLEFIELKNVGSTALELDGVEFTSGVSFTFPSDATLQPDDFFVVASSSEYFNKRYGFNPDGDYEGQLRNSGDIIRIIHVPSGTVLINQTYSDSGSWPGSADGDGYSLVTVKTEPDTDETDSDFWRASTRINGSPHADDAIKTFDSSLFDLRITEINYHPDYPDSAGEDSLEFIEIKNVGSKELDMSDVKFTAGIDYKFSTGVALKPGAFIVLASSPAWFKERYGFDPFDAYQGQLKNSSETITLQDQKAVVELISVTYGDGNPWPAEPDGDGWTLVPMHANPARAQQNNPAAWRQSFRVHGSPGEDDPEIVLVNEVLSHTDTPQVDAVELYNPNTMDINIGGWFLSDDKLNPIKFRIPDNTIVKAGDYIVFTADDFNKDTTFSSFGFGENGDDACLSSDSTGCMGYCHGCSFGALENGISYGRYIIPSTGNEVFVPMKDVTLGEPNSGPLVGPLVISEIMFQSRDFKSDYIEVTNISQQEVKLYDPQYPTDTWRIRIDDDEFLFPVEKTVKSGESVVIFSSVTTVDDFRSTYGIAADVQLFTFVGSLPDTSAKLELEKPMELEKDSTGAVISTNIDYMEYDKISYKEASPWPVGAKGTGSSLTRISTTTFGNDPVNWKIVAPTPGKVE